MKSYRIITPWGQTIDTRLKRVIVEKKGDLSNLEEGTAYLYDADLGFIYYSDDEGEYKVNFKPASAYELKYYDGFSLKEVKLPERTLYSPPKVHVPQYDVLQITVTMPHYSTELENAVSDCFHGTPRILHSTYAFHIKGWIDPKGRDKIADLVAMYTGATLVEETD